MLPGVPSQAAKLPCFESFLYAHAAVGNEPYSRAMVKTPYKGLT